MKKSLSCNIRLEGEPVRKEAGIARKGMEEGRNVRDAGITGKNS